MAGFIVMGTAGGCGIILIVWGCKGEIIVIKIPFPDHNPGCSVAVKPGIAFNGDEGFLFYLDNNAGMGACTLKIDISGLR